ncbi:MAG: exodeoxyribonuclease VII small subunit [Syntrophomonadaceae bacterium]
MPDTPEKLKFEDAIKRIDTITQMIESGELGLEESIKLFEEGVELSLFCRQELNEASGKIQRLIKSLNGELELIDFPENQ